jgi:hypothetical protein
MKIAFIGIVKDGEEYIQRNIEFVRTLGQDIYIVENNSTDNTKNILKFLVQNGTVKKVTTLDLDNTNALDLCKITELCKERVRRLAYIRQKGLESVLESGIPYDYICAIDLDFQSFDRDAFMDMVTYMENNQTVDGIFGMSYNNYNWIYDFGCVRPLYTLIPIAWKLRRYVKVDSAFSGFGVYRYSSIRKKNAKYDYENINHIEHIHFNSHFDNLIVDTHFNPFYTIHPKQDILLMIKLFIFISVVCILLYTYHRLRQVLASYS